MEEYKTKQKRLPNALRIKPNDNHDVRAINNTEIIAQVCTRDLAVNQIANVMGSHYLNLANYSSDFVDMEHPDEFVGKKDIPQFIIFMYSPNTGALKTMIETVNNAVQSLSNVARRAKSDRELNFVNNLHTFYSDDMLLLNKLIPKEQQEAVLKVGACFLIDSRNEQMPVLLFTPEFGNNGYSMLRPISHAFNIASDVDLETVFNNNKITVKK